VLAFQKMVSGKYRSVSWDLKDGARRYGEIRSGCCAAATAGGDRAGAEPRAQALAIAGLIDRRDYGTVPPRSTIA
jgi:hypothetical protein